MKVPNSVVPPVIGGVVALALVVSVIVELALMAVLHQARPEPTAPQLRIPEKSTPRLVTFPTKKE